MIRPGLSAIALDIGSTSIKGAVLDILSSQIVSIASRPFPDPMENLPSGHIEIDPKAIVARVLEVIDELSEPLSQRCSIWICGQMGGLILCDDYGFTSCPGATKAINEFLQDKEEKMISLSGGGGFLIKGTETYGPLAF